MTEWKNSWPILHRPARDSVLSTDSHFRLLNFWRHVKAISCVELPLSLLLIPVLSSLGSSSPRLPILPIPPTLLTTSQLLRTQCTWVVGGWDVHKHMYRCDTILLLYPVGVIRIIELELFILNIQMQATFSHQKPQADMGTHNGLSLTLGLCNLGKLSRTTEGQLG